MEADRQLSEFSVQMCARKDVFDTMCKYKEECAPPTTESVRPSCNVQMSNSISFNSVETFIFISLFHEYVYYIILHSNFRSQLESSLLQFQLRLIDRVIRDGKRVGLHLEKEKQERIKDINAKLSNLGKSTLAFLLHLDTRYL